MDPIPELSLWLNHLFPPPEGSRPRAASALPAESARALPATEAPPPDPETDATEARWAFEAANDTLRERHIGLRFVPDKDLGRHIMQLVDEATGDVLRQIPSEDAVRLARALTGLLVNGKA